MYRRIEDEYGAIVWLKNFNVVLPGNQTFGFCTFFDPLSQLLYIGGSSTTNPELGLSEDGYILVTDVNGTIVRTRFLGWSTGNYVTSIQKSTESTLLVSTIARNQPLNSRFTIISPDLSNVTSSFSLPGRGIAKFVFVDYLARLYMLQWVPGGYRVSYVNFTLFQQLTTSTGSTALEMSSTSLVILSATLPTPQPTRNPPVDLNLAPIAQSKTTAPQISTGPNISNGQENLLSTLFKSPVTLGLVVAVMFLILLCCLTIFILRFNRRNASKMPTVQYDARKLKTLEGSLNTSFGESSTAYTTTTLGYETQTAVATDVGISIPGFLKLNHVIDYRISKQIASGSFGVVYVAEILAERLKHHGTHIVVKELKASNLSDRDVNIFFQELSIMYYLSEERNIAKLIGYTDSPYCMVMKYYPLGSLDTWIKSKKTRKTKTILINFAQDIGSGIRAMSSKMIAHCDIKPQNVLLDQDSPRDRPFCVLTDFGISQILTMQNLQVKAFNVVAIKGASINYASPEALLQLKRRVNLDVQEHIMVDVYAFAVILFNLMTRSTPWGR